MFIAICRKCGHIHKTPNVMCTRSTCGECGERIKWTKQPHMDISIKNLKSVSKMSEKKYAELQEYITLAMQ